MLKWFKQANIVFHSHSTLQYHFDIGISRYGGVIVDKCYCAFVYMCFDQNEPVVIVTKKKEEYGNRLDRPT